MGVKLSPIVTRHPLSFEDLAFKRIAIDGLQCLYQFLSSIRQPDGTPLMDNRGHVTSHLMGIWTRFSNLLQKQVSGVVVFDGIPPKLKMREISFRKDMKDTAAVRYDAAKDDEDIRGMLKYAKQTVHVSDQMVAEAKELLQAMGFPVIQAPMEADAQMAYMNRKGDVWACGTTDFDVLLHAAPRMIMNLTLAQKRRFASGKTVNIVPELIELKEVLSSLSLSQEQLINLAILVGTDYNPGGVAGLGPKKALKLVQQHKTLAALKKVIPDAIPWDEIVDLFTGMPVEKDYKLAWHPMHVEGVKKILVDKHDFSEERIDNVLARHEKGRPKGQKSLGEFV
ncbi:MAG TPA: flap endonuclease-1 [Candidatus Nanoarchaeia archaeon]|nr:flap endonuclease-1 [Candidatus Nanoarchaeia archaeon]